MNTSNSNHQFKTRRRRAVALITVLSVLALIMVLLTALLSATRSEYNSTVAQVEGSRARLHANSVINLAISQLQRAAHQDAATSGVEIWASQPGMVRQYREGGTLLRGFKLYSDSKMIATSEAEIAADTPPADWDKRPGQYVDLNEPVVRMNTADPNGKPRLYFPVIDPRAYSTSSNRSVEGFSYSPYADGVSGQALAGVVAPSGGDQTLQRLPMPVEWLYMLADGTLGFLDDSGKFIGPNGVAATRGNPIISRLAFWTDDESSKININTAGEGTPWDTPRLYHERDGEWAQFQPMAYEYQRYPGHPATVCMSAVLFPGQNMNPLTSDTSDFAKALTYKESIYELMPKILPGGSKAGSVLVPVNRNFTPTDFKEVQKALAERLFPSVDEFLLRATGQGEAGRDEIDLGVGQLWSGLETYEIIERLRPFLTPRSRAPETNPFGYPKISMWPLHRVNFADYRTVFDRTIAYCTQLAGKDYFFTRQDSTSDTELTDIARNKQLFDYLMALTSEPIPGFGAAGATFAQKYGDNRQQILVEIFDYIRSTNLYDENLAETNLGTDAPNLGGGLPNARGPAGTTAGLASKTFTPIRRSNGNSGVGSFPGHGQVTPTVLKSGAESYRGMGRFLTVSEVGLHFIACAEGTTKAGGVAVPKSAASGNAPDGSVMPNWQGGAWGDTQNWYSNFPPLNAKTRDPANGFYKRRYPQDHQLEGKNGDSPEHPGYNPLNWNWTLDRNKPLADGMKRVQATFLLEWFCPAAGWTLINPNLAIEVDASALAVGGKAMFPLNGGKTLIRPYKHMSKANNVSQRGGTIAYRAFLQERKLPPVAKNVNGFTAGTIRFGDSRDPDGANTAYGSFNNRTGVLQQCNQYNLVSDFFDVPTAGAIPFTGGTVVIKILANDDSAKVLQTINVDFPAGQFPTPLLVTSHQEASWTQNANGNWTVRYPTAAPFWWAFHADGALGRDVNGRISADALNAQSELGGRFRYVGEEINYGANRHYRGNFAAVEDTIQSLVLSHGDPRLAMGQHEVPSSEFVPHRYYGSRRMAHNIVMREGSEGPGLDLGNDKKDWRLVKAAKYRNVDLPDTGYSPTVALAMHKYGDFDRGVADQADGAYINKPDEGNTFSRLQGLTGEQLVPYFTQPNTDWSGTSTYFSPNRQVASPGKFGSLPTGVRTSGGSAGQEAWRTLLFRPQTWSAKQEQQPHIGAPKLLKGYGSGTGGWPINGIDPPDYLFMDFFSMPVVEPYAISEPGSTAGKINLNYQMAPFRHIRRATGLAAVLKSELLTAVSVNDATDYLRRPPGGTGERQTWFWKDDSSASGRKFWHRQVDVDATLKLFDERFRSGFAFISPAQICEMYLLPKQASSADTQVPTTWPTRLSELLKSSSSSSILRFWENHALTADNLKERPYTNIYPRLTTRSNTYQVHMRIQTIAKARSADPAKFEIGKDSIGSEYRGSVMLERYLDLNDPALDADKDLDYATGTALSKPPLENFHRFRIIAQKRFDP